MDQQSTNGRRASCSTKLRASGANQKPSTSTNLTAPDRAESSTQMTQHNSASSTTSTTKDTRLENFTQAYLDMGYAQEEAEERGAQRFNEDLDTHFPVYACTNYSTAKEVVYLLEAISMLCCGDLGNREALRLIDMARKGIEASL